MPQQSTNSSVRLLTAVAFHMATVVEVLYSEVLNAAEDLVRFLAMLEKTELIQYRVIRIFNEKEEIILFPTQSFTSYLRNVGATRLVAVITIRNN